MTTFTTEDRENAKLVEEAPYHPGYEDAYPTGVVTSGASVMNNPVCWIDPKELDMAVSTTVTKNKKFDGDIPLYLKPQKYCPSENNEAYEKGFIDGMAKQRDSKVQQMVEGYTHPVKELTDKEIEGIARANVDGHSSKEQLKWFARAILRKAQGK